MRHLQSFRLDLKLTVGVWYFAPGGGRFHDRYVPEMAMADRLELAAGWTKFGVRGIEAHFPTEINDELWPLYKELADETVEGTAGGGAVTVVADGHQNVRSIKISPDAVDPDDISLLEDLVLAAVSDALEKSQKMAQDRLGSLTGNMKIPGLF